MLVRTLALMASFIVATITGCGGRSEVDFLSKPSTDAGSDAPVVLPKLPIDKVDVLVMVDNSRSMNHDNLVAALPAFLTNVVAGSSPITRDLHVAMVTSSLGGGGSRDLCQPDDRVQASENPALVKFNRHNDDRGHLVNRRRPDNANPPPSGVEDPVMNALPANFLAWLPAGGSALPLVPPLSDGAVLTNDFTAMVQGAQSYGCGLEAQMESWYRFLAQPDPYDAIIVDASQSPPAAQLVGIDATILQQRHDFLRPDSLLVVIVVTDEEDSWTDPMWLNGRGWITRSLSNTFTTTGQLPRGTSACDGAIDPNNVTKTGPNDPNCQWCAFNGTQGDPNCSNNKGIYGPKEDNLNVRYVNDMKRRYGMDPQFPIERYIDALTSDLVPSRNSEHTTSDGKLSSSYVGRKTCRNPIYASSLPTDPNGELCKLGRGGRTSDQVLFALIGGVPWQLLTADPKNPNAPYKASLSQSDWQRIVGKDPGHYYYEGIDPHMIESVKPRAGIACGIGAPSTCDPVHGREWDTTSSRVGLDLQYACEYPLARPLDCSKVPDLAQCDCGGIYQGPLCDPNPNDNNNPTLQTRGRAYPTIRELRVAQALGERAVVGSLCKVRAGDDDASYNSTFHALATNMRTVIAAHAH